MTLTNEGIEKIDSFLSDLAAECDLMHEAIVIRQFAICCYSNNNLDTVISHLQSALSRSKQLLDSLSSVQSVLNDLLVKSRDFSV